MLIGKLKGSSVVATFYSLHNLMDVVQIFALVCSTIGELQVWFTYATLMSGKPVPLSNMEEIKNEWKKLFLGTMYAISS